MLKMGETWLEVEVPFFSLPVVKQLDEVALQALTDAMFNQIKLVIDLSAIQLVGSVRQSAYNSAFETLAVTIDEKGKDSPEYAKAKVEALAALSNATHM